jgi:hypothetical protein
MKCYHCGLEMQENTGFIVVQKLWCSLECLAKIYSWEMIGMN